MKTLTIRCTCKIMWRIVSCIRVMSSKTLKTILRRRIYWSLHWGRCTWRAKSSCLMNVRSKCCKRTEMTSTEKSLTIRLLTIRTSDGSCATNQIQFGLHWNEESWHGCIETIFTWSYAVRVETSDPDPNMMSDSCWIVLETTRVRATHTFCTSSRVRKVAWTG